VLATLLAIVARTGSYAVEYATGTAEGPFDPLEPASTNGNAPLSRDQMVLILSALLLLVVLVLGFVVS